MTVTRTIFGLTRRDIRRLKHGRYEFRAIETRHLDRGALTEIV